jgi:hypothetical protein
VLAAVLALSLAAPHCFGAAARDPVQPCANKTRSVTPSPRDAPLIPGTRCTKQNAEDLVVPCAFGSATPSVQFALVGDSHAAHWRPTVTVMAKRLGWRGYALTLNSCGLTTVPRALPEPERSNCETWKGEIVDWLTRHPEITTLFLAQRTLGNADFPRGGRPPFATEVNGFADAWRRLPASLQHVYVIRDNPVSRLSTLPCVSRAIARRWTPAAHCGVPRSRALPPDPAAAAVAQLGDPRLKLVDLTPFFCDSARCYPVVGGVLVYRDVNHLTTLFAETLEPYLERELSRTGF